MSLPGQRAFARLPVLGVALVFCLAGVALLSPPKANACSLLELCVETDSGGTAHLNVPRLSTIEAFAPEPTKKKLEEVDDCYWEHVEVNFGDGSKPETYVWDATAPLTGEHTFPTPGKTYPVLIDATQGFHGGPQTKTSVPCPDFPVEAKAVYPGTPPPPPEEPKPKPPKKEKEKEKESPSKGGNGGDNPGDNPGGSGSESGQGKQPNSGKAAYWRHCGGDVLAHRVGCQKGRSVIRVASKRLDAPGATEVSGFQCRLRAKAGRPISCRSAAARLLGPLG